MSPPPVSKLYCVPEILTEIFNYCIPYGDVTPDARLPYNFILVCSTWRHVAISTPHLWCRFILSGRNCNSTRELDILHTWLRRSQQMPITVHLVLFGDRSVGSVLQSCTWALMRHMRRWRNLVLAMPLPFLRRIIRKVGKGTPLLESIELTRTAGVGRNYCKMRLDELDGEVDIPRHLHFTRGPSRWYLPGGDSETFPIKIKSGSWKMGRIRNVTLNGVDCRPSLKWRSDEITEAGDVGLSSVQQLKLLDVAPYTLCLLRSPAPNLQRLVVYISPNVHLGSLRRKANIVLPSLQYLEIGWKGPRKACGTQVAFVLRSLTVPKLDSLSIYGNTNYTSRASWDELHRFLECSGTQLTRLRVRGFYRTESDLVNILRQVPQLKCFELFTSERGVGEETLQALSIPQTDEVILDGEAVILGLCPGLTTLRLDISGTVDRNDIMIFLLSRWRQRDRVQLECHMWFHGVSGLCFIVEKEFAEICCADDRIRLYCR